MKPTILTTIESLHDWISTLKTQSKQVGFVPTMGALHPGHVSLVSRAKEENDAVMVSIFVNPTQFNNPEDLRLYPRTEDSDILMLKDAGCDAVFMPAVSEMYIDSESEKGHWDFGLLSSTLEGHYRPGHFDGVLTIVKKLFEAVTPNKAYFGEKDFQQLALIKKMVQYERLPIEVLACPTLREEGGLAMSSRNKRLSVDERQIALSISRVLFGLKERKETYTPAELETWGRSELSSVDGLTPEYLEIVDPSSFAPLTDWDDYPEAIALCAVYIGEVRLIDNIIL